MAMPHAMETHFPMLAGDVCLWTGPEVWLVSYRGGLAATVAARLLPTAQATRPEGRFVPSGKADDRRITAEDHLREALGLLESVRVALHPRDRSQRIRLTGRQPAAWPFAAEATLEHAGMPNTAKARNSGNRLAK